jgi:hypothetical protein
VGVDHSIGIFFQQFSANDQHHFFFLVAAFFPVVVVAQVGEAGPVIEPRNVAQLFAQFVRGQAGIGVEVAAGIPELAEVTAPLVGGELAPEQFAGKFVVQANQVSFDEALVGFQQGDAVLFDKLDIG